MSFFSRLFGTPAVTDGDLTFDWNGESIRFSEWADDQYGEFHYTTRSRRHDFTFNLQKVGREVRIYIAGAPSYGSRPSDGFSTHRYGLPEGRPYICVASNLTPTTVPDALSWAVYWAEQTGRYIDTGARFS